MKGKPQFTCEQMAEWASAQAKYWRDVASAIHAKGLESDGTFHAMNGSRIREQAALVESERFESLAAMLQSADVEPICATGEEALQKASELVVGLRRRPDDPAFSPYNLITLALRDSCRRNGVAYVLNGVLSALKRIEVLEAQLHSADTKAVTHG